MAIDASFRSIPVLAASRCDHSIIGLYAPWWTGPIGMAPTAHGLLMIFCTLSGAVLVAMVHMASLDLLSYSRELYLIWTGFTLWLLNLYCDGSMSRCICKVSLPSNSLRSAIVQDIWFISLHLLGIRYLSILFDSRMLRYSDMYLSFSSSS